MFKISSFIVLIPLMLPRILKYAFLIFFLVVSELGAQEKLEVFPLKNRSAEELIPIIRPLLGHNETVTGMRQRLIVRASPGKLEEVKALLEKIDGQLKNLRITVKQGLRSQLNGFEAEVSGEVPIGDSGRVIINPREKGRVIVEGKSGTVQGKFSKRKFLLDEMNTQVVTTLEGNPATIYIGQQIPFKTTESVRSGSTVTQFESTQFKDVQTGFRVLPQIRGDQVIMKISPQQSRITNGGIETTGLDTVIRGRVGEWVELGGLNQNRDEQGSGIANRNTSRKIEKRSVFIKVEQQ
jgi:type II secretory pathway component GspD/PulD (secretin)